MNKHNAISSGMAVIGLFIGMQVSAASFAPDEKMVERGHYLVATSGCNDCHTPGYPEAGGKLPDSQWLTGSPVGFQGPWGTSYPANLRLVINGLSEQQWLDRARSEMRPPMPWFNLRVMTDDDLLAIYHYVRKLGAAGEPAPSYAPPGVAVSTPYFDFVPKNLHSAALDGTPVK